MSVPAFVSLANIIPLYLRHGAEVFSTKRTRPHHGSLSGVENLSVVLTGNLVLLADMFPSCFGHGRESASAVLTGSRYGVLFLAPQFPHNLFQAVNNLDGAPRTHTVAGVRPAIGAAAQAVPFFVVGRPFLPFRNNLESLDFLCHPPCAEPRLDKYPVLLRQCFGQLLLDNSLEFGFG